eukprot:gene5280-5515_t
MAVRIGSNLTWSQQLLGLMAPGSSVRFDTGLLANAANDIIASSYLGGASNLPAGNITAAGYMAVLHYLQEYGRLPLWLPQVFAAQSSILPPWRTLSTDGPDTRGSTAAHMPLVL